MSITSWKPSGMITCVCMGPVQWGGYRAFPAHAQLEGVEEVFSAIEFEEHHPERVEVCPTSMCGRLRIPASSISGAAYSKVVVQRWMLEALSTADASNRSDDPRSPILYPCSCALEKTKRLVVFRSPWRMCLPCNHPNPRATWSPTHWTNSGEM